jgi:cadmium resistance protein CadD (predicted permease)
MRWRTAESSETHPLGGVPSVANRQQRKGDESLMHGLVQILIGSFVLSIIHASIPNHWIPLVAIGKTENWSRRETLWITAISGSAHTISTILVGIIVGFAGYRLSSSYEFVTRIVAPSILVMLGLIYLVLDLRSSHHHRHHHVKVGSMSQKSKPAIIASLCIAMFFSPCIEIEAYYFTAGTLGWLGIAVVSIVYLIVTVLGMLLLVDLGCRGIKKIKWHFLEHHEKRVTGLILIALGIFAYFIKI